MAVDGDGKIAAVDQAFGERFGEAFSDVASAEWDVEGAGIAIKILKPAGHAFEDMEVFGIGEAAFGGAMSGDDVDAAFQRESQNARVGVFGADDGQVCSPPVWASNGSLASAMRSQKRVKRRSLQLMFWQLGRHFIMTAPAARQRSSSSRASGRAGWMETAGRNSGCSRASFST